MKRDAVDHPVKIYHQHATNHLSSDTTLKAYRHNVVNNQFSQAIGTLLGITSLGNAKDQNTDFGNTFF
jgi:hypothetical protein